MHSIRPIFRETFPFANMPTYRRDSREFSRASFISRLQLIKLALRLVDRQNQRAMRLNFNTCNGEIRFYGFDVRGREIRFDSK